VLTLYSSCGSILPAYAGVILLPDASPVATVYSSRVCGGDPTRKTKDCYCGLILPAYAGVILAIII